MQQKKYPNPQQIEGHPMAAAGLTAPNETDTAALSGQDGEGPLAVSKREGTKVSPWAGAKTNVPTDTTLHVKFSQHLLKSDRVSARRLRNMRATAFPSLHRLIGELK